MNQHKINIDYSIIILSLSSMFWMKMFFQAFICPKSVGINLRMEGNLCQILTPSSLSSLPNLYTGCPQKNKTGFLARHKGIFFRSWRLYSFEVCPICIGDT